LGDKEKMSTAKLAYPETRRDDVAESLHGIRIEDPYRWLEGDTPEVRGWEAQQNALAEAVLAEWPDRDRLRRAVRQALLEAAPDAEAHPTTDGRFRFWLGSTLGGQYPALWVREGEGGWPRLLVDPNALEAGSNIDWFYPSRDGEYVAYGVSRNGNEQSVLHVVESASGRLLPGAIPHTSFCCLAWLPDSSGFYYSGGRASDFEDPEKWLFFHTLGEPAQREPEPVRFQEPYITPQLSPDGRYLVVTAGWEVRRVAYLLDRAAGGDWRPVMPNRGCESWGRFDADRYLMLTTYGAPRGRILSVPLATAPDETTWTEVVPQGEGTMRHFALADGRLVIGEIHEAVSRLRVFTMADGSERTVALPGLGKIEGLGDPTASPFSLVNGRVSFRYATFTEPARQYSFDVSMGDLLPEGAGRSLAHLEARRVYFTARDGARVPMFLVHRRGLDLSHPRPALLHGYGGWNLAPEPDYVGGRGYTRCVLPFVAAGGVYAFACLRGGTEYGRDWWQAGRLGRKQTTFDDFYAAAEHLIASGLTMPGQLAAMGASNGGLLAAAALTQRPDLFRAVVAEVPMTDMARCMNDPYLVPYRLEYGDPDDPEMLRVLLAYSPLHNVREGERYPAALFQCGRNDLRCQPWNGRKMAAALQRASAGPGPVLYKVQPGGHGPGISFDELLDRNATVVGFVMAQLGMRMA
jgi:prolyl oligopeptidase